MMNMHASPVAPIILTDRQEQFCQHILAAKSHTEAYRLAYNASQKAAEANGARAIRSDRIQARLAQLRAENAAAERVSLPFLTRGLRSAIALAERTNQPGAAIAGWMGIAKLHGMIIDKQQVDAVIRRPSMEPSSPDEMTEEMWLSKHALTSLTIDHTPMDYTNEIVDSTNDSTIELEPEPQPDATPDTAT